MFGLRKRRRLLFAAILIAVLAAAFLFYGCWEAAQIRVVEVELRFDDLPAAFDGFRIIQLADLHTQGYGRVERRLRRILAHLRADLLVVVGDFQAHISTPDAPVLASLDRLFESLEYPWGMLACPGNHDSPEFYDELARRGRFTCLGCSSIILERGGQCLAFLGVVTSRPLDGGRGTNEIEECTWVGNVLHRSRPLQLLPDTLALPQACHRLNDGRMFRILLAHNPEFVVRAAEAGIPLVLSGDTHGGQIRLPLIGPLLAKSSLHRRFNRGHFIEGRTQVYVNPGIGTLYIPIRFLCRPEVTVLTLRRSRSD